MKKWTAFLLLLVLCLSLLPLTAFAEGMTVDTLYNNYLSGKTFYNEGNVAFYLDPPPVGSEYYTIVFQNVDAGPTNWTTVSKSTTLPQSGNSYTYTNKPESIVFTVSDNAVTSVVVSGFPSDREWRNGTYLPPHTHDFSGDAVSHNDGTHSYKCADAACTEIGVMDGTTPVVYAAGVEGFEACSGGTATSTAKAVCAKCHAAYGDVLSVPETGDLHILLISGALLILSLMGVGICLVNKNAEDCAD